MLPSPEETEFVQPASVDEPSQKPRFARLHTSSNRGLFGLALTRAPSDDGTPPDYAAFLDSSGWRESPGKYER